MRNHYIKKTAVSLLRASLTQPFRTAFGQHDSLENVLFSLQLEDGTKGYGEAALAPHITGETLGQTIKNLKSAGRFLLGKDSSDYLRLSCALHERLPHNTAAIAAIEMSLLDALTRQWGIPLWRFFGRMPQRRLATDITIVIADLEETKRAVKRFYKQGLRIFKVKIGRNEDLDYQRVLAVKKLAPRAKIYLDVNQGYTAEEALRFLRLLQRAGVRPVLVEQPVPKADWEGLKRVSRLGRIPVCADESVSSLSEVIRAIRERAVRVINIKLMKFGLFQAREAALLAQAAGLELMMGGMLESSLAMTAAAHLAAGIGGFSYIDLDTPFFIKGPLGKNPYLNQRGIYDVGTVKAGIGMVPPAR